MKRVVFILLTAIFCNFLSLNAAPTEYAEGTFPISKHDFGYIKEEKGQVSCTFEFVNTGNKPLLIVEAVASCGCTKPEYPKNPIAPGKKGKVKVTYNPANRPGAFLKNIKVKTNGREGHTTLVIQGAVIPMKSK